MWPNQQSRRLLYGLGGPTSNAYHPGYHWLNYEFKLQQLFDERPQIKIKILREVYLRRPDVYLQLGYMP